MHGLILQSSPIVLLNKARLSSYFGPEFDGDSSLLFSSSLTYILIQYLRSSAFHVFRALVRRVLNFLIVFLSIVKRMCEWIEKTCGANMIYSKHILYNCTQGVQPMKPPRARFSDLDFWSRAHF